MLCSEQHMSLLCLNLHAFGACILNDQLRMLSNGLTLFHVKHPPGLTCCDVPAASRMAEKLVLKKPPTRVSARR